MVNSQLDDVAGERRPRQVRSWIAFHAAAAPGRVAMHDLASGRSVTYGELDNRVLRIGQVLVERFGVTRGERVAILSRNCIEAFEAMYACAAIGAIFVPLNVRLSDRELDAIFADAAPAVLLCEAAMGFRSVATAGPRLIWGADRPGDDDFEQALGAARPAGHRDVDMTAPWTLIYTSGTTGKPKGVVVTHEGSEATMLSTAVACEVDRSTMCLTALPVWHVAGLNLFANATLFMGGTVLVMQSFDPAATLELLVREAGPVTHFCGVPANFQFIQALPQFEHARLRPFVAVVGGSPVPKALVEAWAGRGIELRTVFGISEGGSSVTMTPAGAAANVPGDVGIPLMHIECRIVAADGQVCGSGEPGEIQIRGTSVTPGYWNRPDLTAQTVVDGWLHTGDAGRIEANGHVVVVDRLKDMYISGGENVYPAEVEEVLYGHPAIAQVAVVRVADERWGESGAAWVVLKAGCEVDADELRSWARHRLAAFKVPRDVHFVSELPRNATGKVLKGQLLRWAENPPARIG